jgi:predicted RNA-binding protein YlxR (DUF448 family)
MRNPRNEPAEVKLPFRKREGPGEGLSKSSRHRNNPSPNPSREREGDCSHTPERTCVLTRRKAEKDELIRLALSPDGTDAPDIRARAPGRGAWIAVSHSQLAEAVANGKLKGALQRAFKTGEVTVPPDLADRTAEALRQAALDRLGMEARAGNLVNGSERIEASARSGKVHLLIHASDAGEDGCRKLDQAWRVGGREGQGLIFPEDRTILSLALGRENVVHLALTDPAAAARVLSATSRWNDFIDPEAGLKGGAPALGTGSAEEVEGIE